MQVAVAGVEHVRAAQSVLLGHSGDLEQHLGQRPPRNRAVHAVVVGRDAADRRERGLASGPEEKPLLLVLRHADLRGSCVAEHAPDLRHVGGDLLRCAVGLDEQHGGGVERVVGVHVLVDRARGGLVHHLEAGREDAGGDHRAHRRAGLGDVVERGERDLRELGLGRELDGDLGDHREQTFRAVDQCEQVVARRVRRFAAQLHDLAAHQHATDATHVVDREPVLEAVHPAGILGDVAADRARDLRRGIGRVVEPVSGGGLGNREVAHPRLHDRGAGELIDAQDPVELGEREQHAALVRQRATRKARSRAAGDDRDARIEAAPEDRDDLRLGLGQRHGGGALAVQRQPVALVRPRFLGGSEQRRGRQDRRQLGMYARIEHDDYVGHPDAARTKRATPPRTNDYFTSRAAPHGGGPGGRAARGRGASRAWARGRRLPLYSAIVLP
jgi:hypothetical protein